MANVIDDQVDAPVAAVADLLALSLRTHFGPAVVVRAYTWPARHDVMPAMQVPALVVCRETERSEPASDAVEHVTTTTLRIEYYAPVTPLDRIERRWQLLRSAWERMQLVLRMGWHPSYLDDDELPVRLSAFGWETPASVVGVAKYELFATDSGLVPRLVATVTLRSSTYHDTTDYPSDDLETLVSTVAVDDDEEHPAFEMIVDDLDE